MHTRIFFSLQAGLAVLVLILVRRFLRKKLATGIYNLPGPKPASWLKGNLQEAANAKAWGYNEFLAKEYGSTIRFPGPFGTNMIYTFDPKVMYSVLLKDQDAFGEDNGFRRTNLLVFGEGLLGTSGHSHRRQRKMLSPVFSAAHMRDMVPTFFDISHKLERTLKTRLQSNTQSEGQEVEILSWMARTALELVGQAGLGYSFDPLTDDECAHPYTGILKELIPNLTRLSFWTRFDLPISLTRIGSPTFRRFVLNMIPWKDLHHLRDMVDYMHSHSKEVYESKKGAFEKGDEAVARQIGGGNDIISVLMKENRKTSNKDERLEDNEVIGQMSTLIFAAMDTTSSAMARILHLLSHHTEVQDRLRQELIEAKNQNGGQDLSYDELVALPYLDAVCRETLRLYAPVPIVTKSSSRDTVIPLSRPIIGLDGTEMHEVSIPKGTGIIISIFNANRNPDLWGKDANEWKPERWLSPLPEAVTEARIPGVYSHLMTFIGGRRSCIGFKFSQLEMKVVISVLLESFKFSPSARDSEIFWQMNGVAAPVVGEDKHPCLPINIQAAN